MRRLPFVLPLLLAACGAGKPEAVTPDYGDESADLKADSPQAPASIVNLQPGTIATATFTSKSQYRAFRVAGEKGQTVSVYLDGLGGLDTVVAIYRVSAVTGRPYGRALVVNDDTRVSGWTVQSNTQHNPLSSSIIDFTFQETRTFAVVATTYDGSPSKAELVVKAKAPAHCAVIVSNEPRPQFCIEIYRPVCGCDGKTYGNDCVRRAVGVTLDREGVCPKDLDDAAREHVYGSAANQRIFASEAEATARAQANPTGERWLARDGETGLALRFVWGTNDLWAERFEVNKLTREVTVTAEH
jgi:hypothetical protein